MRAQNPAIEEYDLLMKIEPDDTPDLASMIGEKFRVGLYWNRISGAGTLIDYEGNQWLGLVFER